MDRNILELLLWPLRRGLTAERPGLLLRMHADAEVQTRYEFLAARNTEGKLTPDERVELESMFRVNLLLTVLKAEARDFLCYK